MNVIICKRPSDQRVEVQFHNWKEDRTRYARIEYDILKKVGCMSSDPFDYVGEVMYLFRDAPLSNFTNIEIRAIAEVLRGYCIEPDIQL